MDATQALADLTEISSQIETAVLFDEKGDVAASTIPDEVRSRRLAESARKLVQEAAGVRHGSAGDEPSQLEVATLDGSVFVVRTPERSIVATTSPEPTVGLVFYDLKSCLHGVALSREAAQPKRKPAARRQRKAPAEAGTDGGGEAA